MKKLSKTQLLPLALLLYLAFMAHVGRSHLHAGNTLYYYGVIVGSLVIIVLLYIVLRKRDRVRAERDEKLSRTYRHDNENPSHDTKEVKD